MNNDNNKKPVSPIYAVAILWLAWSLLIPLFAVLHYVLLIVAAVMLYKVVTNLIEKKTEKRNAQTKVETDTNKEKTVENKPKSNIDPKIEKLMKDRDLAISEMRRLNQNILNEKISEQIDDLEQTTTKIFDIVIAHPDREAQIRKFLNYYLPTTLKLLNTYDRMNSQGVSGENISSTMTKVDETLDMIVAAFHKQLDTLFAGEALDVSADIKVMENLMKTEGLADDDISQMTTIEE